MFSTKDPFFERILRIWAITGYHSEAWPVADIQVLHRGGGMHLRYLVDREHLRYLIGGEA